MRVKVNKSEINGSVKAPSSKSYTVRALMCSALAKGESQILCPLVSDDSQAAINVLSKIGVSICLGKDVWLVHGNNFHAPDGDIFCGESAATLRFMTAICSVVPGKCRLTAGPTLAKRPVRILVDALKQLGADVSCDGENAPVLVSGGILKGGASKLRGDISSQFVSALLLVAPYAENGVNIKLTAPLESKPYVLMTIQCMEQFGIKVIHSEDLLTTQDIRTLSYLRNTGIEVENVIREFRISPQFYTPAKYTVEGDWSSASYLLALGAVAGCVEVRNLESNSLQADRVLVEMLARMGVSIESGSGCISTTKSKPVATKENLSECIDLLPTMAVLAALADGTSEFHGIRRARLKESNRVTAVKAGLEKAGISVTEEEDKIVITGGKTGECGIDSFGDHRIAMAFSILGATRGGVTIDGAECVSKTYPDYWSVLQSLGGDLKYE